MYSSVIIRPFLNLIILARGGQFLERIFAVDRHDPVAHLVRRAVQGNGQAKLQRLVGEPADLRREAAGGNR